jgi:sporulation protein YlmC with PRC-barrel domain
MTKKLLSSVALAALLSSAALMPAAAQTQPQTAPQTQGATAGTANFVTAQTSDQWLASSFKGTDVLGADNQKIGDVSDILFDKSGKIEAYVISVGGFLGMGAKEVALAPSSFDVVPGSNGGAPQLKVAMNKDQLQQAQNFKPYESHPTTTGSGAMPSGTPGAMRPSTNTPPTGR